MGAAVIQDCARFVSHRLALDYESAGDTKVEEAMRDAVRLMLEPQLAGHFEDDRRQLIDDVFSTIFADASDQHPSGTGEGTQDDADDAF